MDELFTFKEAAEFLRVSEKTLIKLLGEEEVPARKLGNKWIFSRDALIKWISEGKSTQYSKNAHMEEETEHD